MTKWLAIAGVAVLAVLAVLWQQLDTSSAQPAAAATRPTPAPAAMPAPVPAPAAAKVAAAAEPAPVEEAPAKLDPQTDEFFYAFVEAVPKRLTAQAASCYEGIAHHLHRNQKLSLRFKTRIRDGVVTVHDVTIKENTLNNPGLEACFIQAVQRATWTDPSLPDYDDEDELVLRPERGMKKYMRDNIEYQGTAAPEPR